MEWKLEEAIRFYQIQGAKTEQSELVNLLREIQTERGGAIPEKDLKKVADALDVKKSFLLAVIKRMPGLCVRPGDDEDKSQKDKDKNKKKDKSRKTEDRTATPVHCLEVCCGGKCMNRGRLESFIRKTYGTSTDAVEIKFTGCMHMCGKGPNIKWDGVTYQNADEALIRKLMDA